MMKFREYHYDKFREEFKLSETYRQLTIDHPGVQFDLDDIRDVLPDLNADRRATYCNFYYINLLLEKNPATIIDVCCGPNFFKKYVSNIIGMDIHPGPNVDIVAEFNDDYVAANFQKYDSAMSINGLHFIPFTEFGNRLNSFVKLVKPGGRAFAIFNAARMIERTDASIIDRFNLLDPDSRAVYVNDQLKQVNHTILELNCITTADTNRLKIFNSAQREIYNVIKGSAWPDYDSYVTGNYDVSSEVKDDIINRTENVNLSSRTTDPTNSYLDGNIKIVIDVK